jgi:hypothetical protein
MIISSYAYLAFAASSVQEQPALFRVERDRYRKASSFLEFTDEVHALERCGEVNIRVSIPVHQSNIQLK